MIDWLSQHSYSQDKPSVVVHHFWVNPTVLPSSEAYSEVVHAILSILVGFNRIWKLPRFCWLPFVDPSAYHTECSVTSSSVFTLCR